MPIFSSSGSFDKTFAFLKEIESGNIFEDLDALAQSGVDALSRMTPIDTGLAASSWGYVIENTRESLTISWFNTDEEGGVNVAIILQYGHGTGTGGYVAGIDYINPAIQPIFDQIAEEVWRRVTQA